MSQTEHYSLNKPTGSDLVNPLVDTFPNWDIVDREMYKNYNLGVTGAEETVLQGVHAIIRANTDLPFFHFLAVANFSAGDTFTLDGVSVTAYTPDGNILVGGAFVSGANIIGYYNSTNSSITLYLNTTSGSGGSIDADTLDGHDSTYFATAQSVTNIREDLGSTDISAIGDGKVTGAIKTTNTLANTINTKVGDLVNLLTSAKNNVVSAINEIVGRLTANGNSLQLDYQNGKYGLVVDNVFYELGGGNMPLLDYANPLHTFTSGNLSYTAISQCWLVGSIHCSAGNSINVQINSTKLCQLTREGNSTYDVGSDIPVPIVKLNVGDVVTISSASDALHVYSEV